MISYNASIAKICFFYRLYDRQWSLTLPRSSKYVSFLDSMIVNDLNLCLINASVAAQMCLIWNDLLQSLGRPNQFRSMISYNEFRLNDRQSLCVLFRLSSMIFYEAFNLCLIWTKWSSMILISYNASIAKICSKTLDLGRSKYVFI